jgi:hypothetical protein
MFTRKAKVAVTERVERLQYGVGPMTSLATTSRPYLALPRPQHSPLYHRTVDYKIAGLKTRLLHYESYVGCTP